MNHFSLAGEVVFSGILQFFHNKLDASIWISLVLIAMRVVADMQSNGLGWLFYQLISYREVMSQQLFAAVKNNDVKLVRSLLRSSGYRSVINWAHYDGWTPLHAAADAGLYEIMEMLIKAGADIEKTDAYGTTAMMFCCKGHVNCMKLLLKHGANPHKKDTFGANVLTLACMIGHQEVILLLLNQKGIEINSVDGQGRSALLFAVRRGCVRSVGTLLEHGADPNIAEVSGRTPLHVACVYGPLVLLDMLIAKGAHLNHKDSYGSTPLMQSAYLGHSACVDKLIAAGVLLDIQDEEFGSTALILAASKGQVDCGVMLLEAGADYQARDKHGRTVLMIAALASPDFLKMLLAYVATQKDENELRAFVDTVDNYGTPALHFAALEGDKQCVSELLAAGCAVNATERSKRTALMMASYKGRTDVVQMLIDNGADVLCVDEYGRTALILASDVSVDCCLALLRAGADPNVSDTQFGGTALIMACCQGNLETVKALLNGGADVNKTDHGHRSPIMLASYKGHSAVIQLLVEYGADVNAKDTKFGMNSLMLSSHMGHQHCVEVLLDAGADSKATDFEGVPVSKTASTLEILRDVLLGSFGSSNYLLK